MNPLNETAKTSNDEPHERHVHTGDERRGWNSPCPTGKSVAASAVALKASSSSSSSSSPGNDNDESTTTPKKKAKKRRTPEGACGCRSEGCAECDTRKKTKKRTITSCSSSSSSGERMSSADGCEKHARGGGGPRSSRHGANDRIVVAAAKCGCRSKGCAECDNNNSSGSRVVAAALRVTSESHDDGNGMKTATGCSSGQIMNSHECQMMTGVQHMRRNERCGDDTLVPAAVALTEGSSSSPADDDEPTAVPREKETRPVVVKTEEGTDVCKDRSAAKAKNIGLLHRLKPSFPEGSEVYAPRWPGSSSDRNASAKLEWFPGRVRSMREEETSDSSSPYGPARFYDIKYDNGDEIDGVEDYYVFSGTDYRLFVKSSDRQRPHAGWIGVKNVVDRENEGDTYPRVVGWYVATVDGKERPFSLLSDAMDFYDNHIVQCKALNTKPTDLNRPEKWSWLFERSESEGQRSHLPAPAEMTPSNSKVSDASIPAVVTITDPDVKSNELQSSPQKTEISSMPEQTAPPGAFVVNTEGVELIGSVKFQQEKKQAHPADDEARVELLAEIRQEVTSEGPRTPAPTAEEMSPSKSKVADASSESSLPAVVTITNHGVESNELQSSVQQTEVSSSIPEQTTPTAAFFVKAEKAERTGAAKLQQEKQAHPANNEARVELSAEMRQESEQVKPTVTKASYSINNGLVSSPEHAAPSSTLKKKVSSSGQKSVSKPYSIYSFFAKMIEKATEKSTPSKPSPAVKSDSVTSTSISENNNLNTAPQLVTATVHHKPWEEGESQQHWLHNEQTATSQPAKKSSSTAPIVEKNRETNECARNTPRKFNQTAKGQLTDTDMQSIDSPWQRHRPAKRKDPFVTEDPSDTTVAKREGDMRLVDFAEKTICNQRGCANKAQKGGICRKHGGVQIRYRGMHHICRHDGCTHHAMEGGVCLRHGAKPRQQNYIPKKCTHDGCSTFTARRGGVCVKHGAKLLGTGKL